MRGHRDPISVRGLDRRAKLCRRHRGLDGWPQWVDSGTRGFHLDVVDTRLDLGTDDPPHIVHAIDGHTKPRVRRDLDPVWPEVDAAGGRVQNLATDAQLRPR